MEHPLSSTHKPHPLPVVKDNTLTFDPSHSLTPTPQPIVQEPSSQIIPSQPEQPKKRTKDKKKKKDKKVHKDKMNSEPEVTSDPSSTTADFPDFKRCVSRHLPPLTHTLYTLSPHPHPTHTHFVHYIYTVTPHTHIHTLSQFPPILTDHQRIDYKQTFNHDYAEYLLLKETIDVISTQYQTECSSLGDRLKSLHKRSKEAAVRFVTTRT